MKKKFSLFLILIMILAFALTLFACTDNGEDIIDDPIENPTKEKITVPQAMQSTYDGIMAGSDALGEAAAYSVESVYTLHTEEINYTITYKANYAENEQDSEIYLSFFDNQPKEHKNRLSVYYDKKNLYLSTDFEKKYIEDFSMTSMFNAFFELVQYADLSNNIFSQSGAYIFNRENTGLNLGVLLNANNVDRNVVTETRDSLMYSDIKLDIVSDTVNAYMDNYLGDIGDKFDVITEKYLGFRLSRVISPRFQYIKVNQMNFQRENGVADFAKIDASGQFMDQGKYQIDGQVGYKIATPIEIQEKASFDPTNFEHINLGQKNYVGKILIPALSAEDFDINIITNIDTNDNSKNELSIDIVDAKKSHLIEAYYRNEVMFTDISGLESQYVKDAIDLDAFNLPKVYFDGINLTSFINAFYTSGIKMLTTLLDKGFAIGDAKNENLYAIIMENFGSEGNTVYYTITEELIQLIREDDTRTAIIIADLLGIPVEKLDSILGEEFFSLSSIKISYNLDTGTIGLSYLYDNELVFRMTVDAEDYNGIIFPSDTLLSVNAYNRLIIPNDIKTEIIVELEVSNGKAASDMSQALGAFIGDPSGKNTPYNIKAGETLVLKAQASESFISLGSSELISEYLIRFDIFNKKDMLNAIISMYSNPQNFDEFLVSYALNIGKDLYKKDDGLKFKIAKSEVSSSLDEILGQNNVFDDNSLFGIISEILKGKSSRTQIANSDGYFNFILQVETDPKTGEKYDPVKRLIGVSDLIARVKTRFLFSEVVLNDITPTDFYSPVVGSGNFESAVGIESLYSPNSYWKDTIEVQFENVAVNMVPNYIEETIKISGDKNQYTPTCRLFGKESSYIMSISSELGTYTIKRLLSDTIIIDPAFTNKLPTKIEVEFTNGIIGELSCKIEGLSDNIVTPAGFHLEVFANDRKQTYTLRIGGNSIMETTFTVYVAVQNRTVVKLTEGEGEELEELTDDNNVPVIGIINLDPYEYAMRKDDNPSYNPITEGIIEQNMRLNFKNVYAQHEVSGEDLTFDAEGFNYFFLQNLDMDWQFDESKIKYNGVQLFAYAYYGEGATKIKIAIKVNVMAKAVSYVKINNEENNKYTIDSLVQATYAIPTQTGVNTSVQVYFGDQTYRIVQLNRPENISDKDYYKNYLPAELAWYIPNPNYMGNVSLASGASALFGAGMGNFTYANISIGNLGIDRVNLYVEVPERWISTADMQGETAIKRINENGDGTFTLTNPTPVQISPVMFSENGQLYEYFSINPYDEDGKLPNEIFMRVYKQYTDKNEQVMKKYRVNWLTTLGDGGEETNILYIDGDGYTRLKNPTTDQNDFLVYGVVGDGNFAVVISTWVRNLASELKSIEYEGLPKDVVELTIDPYKAYTLPSKFTATLASNEKVYRTNIAWMVKKDGDTVWVPIDKPTSGNFDPAYYDKNGKYLFHYEGGTYWIRYILEASSSVLRQEMLICIRVQPRTIVQDTINIYETGRLTTGYTDINYYKADSKVLLDRINDLINDTQKVLRIGIGFEEARTDLILDRYNLYVEWLRAVPTDANYKSSIDYLAYSLQNPKGEEVINLKGTIYTGTVNEQVLNVTFSLAGLVISNITINNAEYSESIDAVYLPQKTADGRINMSSILEENQIDIEISKVFALTMPVNNLERYASPYQYINYIFEKIIMVYYNGTTDSEITPVLDFGDYTEDSFNRKVLGRTDGVYSINKESETIIYIKKLSAGSAQENIKVYIKAKIDERKDKGDQITAELYNELGESCTQEGYLLPTYLDVEYVHSGIVRYYLGQDGWRTSDLSGAGTATNIELTSINVLSGKATSHAFYYVLPMQGFIENNLDDGYYHLNINIPRKNINNVNYNAVALDSTYDITDGYITINNAYLFYNNKVTYTIGNRTYNTGFDYTRLPDIINAKIVPDYFESTSINYFIVSWTPRENAITESDIVNGIDREDKRVLATAEILSYYNEAGEHVSQTVTVYIEMEEMAFSGIEYSVNGVSLDIRKDEQLIGNTIVIDPYDEKIGYNGIFRLPTIGLVLNFENNEKFTVTPSSESAEDPQTDDIRRFELLDKDMEYIRTISTIPYGYSGYILQDSNLPLNGLLYVKMVMFTGQEIILTINILSRVVDQAIIENTVISNGIYEVKNLARLYYVDPYNSITHQLPAKASIFFLNSDEFATLSISRWEILDMNTQTYKDVNSSPYFYSIASNTNAEYKYAYYNSGYQDGYTGGVFTLRAYISMGTSTSGVNIGEQGFDVTVVILNRSLKTMFTTSYEYTDPIAGLLEDIGGILDKSMFVDYDKFYAAEFKLRNIDKENYYSAISDGPMEPQIDWARYVDDSAISYEGFTNREVQGYLYTANTNLNFMYNMYKNEVETTYAELIKSMTWDSFFNEENGKLVPLNYYSTDTNRKLREALSIIEIEVKNQTFRQLLQRFNAAENTAVYAQRMESTLLRSVMSNNPTLKNDQEGIAFLYDMLRTQYGSNDIKAEDRIIFLAWVDLYNNFKGHYAGFVENIDAERLTPYQMLKRDMYDKAERELYFYGAENNYNNALYAAAAKKLNNNIKSAIWQKMFNMATSQERERMLSILGDDSNITSRANALSVLMISDLKTVGSYGEIAFALISAPQVTFDKFKENIDTFYFNIYTTLALDEEVLTEFLINKEAIFGDLIDVALEDVIDAYRKGIISTTLEEYFNALKAKIVNTMVPVDSNGDPVSFYYDESFHTYDYAVDKATYSNPDKRAAAITEYRSAARQKAIEHVGAYTNETTAQAVWNSLRGAYIIKSNTAMVAVMDDIFDKNYTYVASTDKFKQYLQDEASKRYDLSIEYADKLISGLAVEGLISNPKSIGDSTLGVESYEVFAAVYGPHIGQYGSPGHIYDLVYKSLNSDKQTLLNDKYVDNQATSGSDSHMRTIYYFLYDSFADPIIKAATQDFFYLKLCEASGKNFYDLLYQKSQDGDNENKESLQIYLDNAQLNGYSNSEYDLELRKARVFRSLETYYENLTGEGDNYRSLIKEISASVLIDIKGNAYDILFSDLFLAYLERKQSFKEEKGNVYATAFDYLIKSYEKDADTIIKLYNDKIDNYVEENIYKYAESLYNKALENKSFEYVTSAENATKKNYLDINESEERLIENRAVEYYYNNLASQDEKLNLEAASEIFGEIFVGGKYQAPQGVYQYLMHRYDFGDAFIADLNSLRYHFLLSYAQENIEAVVQEVNANPIGDNYYTEFYYNVQKNKLNAMGTSVYSEDVILQFAKKGYIDYKIKQVVLKNYLSEKQTINTNTLIPQGKEMLYYKLYVNAFNEILENEGISLDGATAYYYNLFAKLPQDSHITDEQLYDILQNKVVLRGEKASYYSIFSMAQEIMSQLEDAKYNAQLDKDKTRYFDTYNTIKTYLQDKALEKVVETVDKVEIQSGFVKVFDELILPYYNEELYLPSYVSNKTRQELKTQLAMKREDVSYVDDAMVEGYDSYLENANATQKAFLEAIGRQEMLRSKISIVNNHIKTIAYMDLVYIINTSITEVAFNVDYDLTSILDIENETRTQFSEDAKEAYINLVIELLNEENFYISSAVIENIVKENRYTTDFIPLDSQEGMSEEEKVAYLAEFEEYKAYLQKIYDKLLLTSMNQTVKSYQEYIDTGKFLSTLKSAINDNISTSLENFTKDIYDGNESDATYIEVLQKMVNDATIEYKFYTQDHIASADPNKGTKNKHLLYFDVQVLQDEENSSTQDINKIYLTNASKKDKDNPATVIKRDGFRFIYPQIEIVYVDYYGETDVQDAQDKDNGITTTENKFLNKITIDPLNPDLPSKVRAYGKYRKVTGGGAYGILDVGMINVTYDDIFRSLEGEYAGNLAEGDSSSSYQITAVNNKNDQFLISLTVFYLNRTVQSYYVNSSGYTSSANIINSGDYAKYYNLYDSTSNKNKITIDPTQEEMVDKDNKTYLLPTAFVANYTNYENDTYRSASPKTISYYNVVWDLSSVKYTLSGLKETPLRILSYYTNVGDGTYNRLAFDYVNNNVKITKFSETDNSIISVNTFVGIPSNAIWNVTLTVTTKTVDKIYLTNEFGEKTLFAKFISDDVSGIGNSERWLVAESDFAVNPYYVEFFENIVLEFSDGDLYEINDEIEWNYHSQNGVDKLKDIVNKSITEPNNRYIVAGFNYISEIVWVKLMIDNIEIERPLIVGDDGTLQPGYINGGTIYLLAQTPTYSMTKEAQFASFYPYMYYNFSKDKFNEDWRRVPLTFEANDTRDIVLWQGENRVYENILATLGNNSSGSNISFTVKVINPKLFALLSGDNNQFVLYDSISMPIDGNSRVISQSSDMPQIMGNYFVQLNGAQDTLFHILSTSYDVVNEKVTYECNYYMDSSDVVAGQEGGVRTLSFKAVLPLQTYNYTGINDVKFVQDAGDNYSWKNVNSYEETDSLYWKLGSQMKPSLLPKGYDTATGERISFMWDLDNINVNLATGESYYAARAYYYSASAQWVYKEVNIYITREDISNSIVDKSTIEMVYNGNKYTYELDYSKLNKLRADGSFAQINLNNIMVEYRINTSSEINYSTTNKPLNAGTYYIRITIDDYNFFGEKIVTLIISPYKIKGIATGVGGQGIIPDLVFDGADANNYIRYTYNGQTQGLVVNSGLPFVHVQNWPQNRDQKEQLYLSKLNANPTSGEITIAKSAAYNELFEKVTSATQIFLSKFKAQAKIDYNIISENELNAKVFDLLDYNLYICELVPTIIYKNASDIILEKEPVDVGTYLFSYNIEASKNNGNYILDERTLPMAGRIVIEKQDVTYSLVSEVMVYNGNYQNPLINNLHLPNGNLPIGVTVTYTYTYIQNLEQIITNQVRNVRSYALKIEIDGGNNYPSATLDNLTVSIVPQDLFISFDEEKTQSEYLSKIVDYGKHLDFDGLIGNDKAIDFYAPMVSGNVKDYYTLGKYPIQINGFKLDEYNLETYTKYDGDPIEIDGVKYYKLALKDASEAGSLYSYVDATGKFVYETLINKFQNYNIYVKVNNSYTIYPDGEAILVANDAELSEAIAQIPDGGRATIYLAEGEYASLIININASITIIGCYDENAKIISTLGGIIIREGEVTLRIIDIKGKSNADSVYIGDKAGMVSIIECYLDGLGLANSRAIVTSTGYNGLLYINSTTITRYTRALEFQNGTAEISQSVFTANSFGIFSYTKKEMYIRDCEFTSTSSVAMYLEHNNYVVLECHFAGNSTAVKANESGRNKIILENTFDSTNGNDFLPIG